MKLKVLGKSSPALSVLTTFDFQDMLCGIFLVSNYIKFKLIRYTVSELAKLEL